MFSLLIVIIYMSFISLGLPDSLLGSGWPVMHAELGVPVSYAGIIAAVISVGTIMSSIMSARFTKKFGTAIVTIISVLLTAIALIGFSFADKYYMLVLIAIPYGLGAGGVDAALNNYVALNYSSRHMSWLHASWGIGATISPYIMSLCLTNGLGWHMGYRTIGIIQSIFVLILVSSIPLWKKSSSVKETENSVKVLTTKEAIKLPGVLLMIVAFFCYYTIESTAGQWASSYMEACRNVSAEVAAKFTSYFYFGITGGRILNGFIANKFSDRTMIRAGIIIMLTGTLLIILPLSNTFALIGLIIIGLGCAPVYPSIIHSIPDNFGEENSQSLVGLQMAGAYSAGIIMPPLFGIIAEHISLYLYPVFILLFIIITIVSLKIMYNILKKINDKNN